MSRARLILRVSLILAVIALVAALIPLGWQQFKKNQRTQELQALKMDIDRTVERDPNADPMPFLKRLREIQEKPTVLEEAYRFKLITLVNRRAERHAAAFDVALSTRCYGNAYETLTQIKDLFRDFGDVNTFFPSYFTMLDLYQRHPFEMGEHRLDPGSNASSTLACRTSP